MIIEINKSTTSSYGKYFLAFEAPRKNNPEVTVEPEDDETDIVPETDDITPEEDDVTPEVDDVEPEMDDVTPETDDVQPATDDNADTQPETSDDNADDVQPDTDFNNQDDNGDVQPATDDGSQSDGNQNSKGPGLEYDSTRKYNLFKEYMSLYNALDNYVSKLEDSISDNLPMNQVIKVAVNKLREIKDLTYDFMMIKFELSSYVQSLLFYQNLIVSVQLVFNLIKKAKEKDNKK